MSSEERHGGANLHCSPFGLSGLLILFIYLVRLEKPKRDKLPPFMPRKHALEKPLPYLTSPTSYTQFINETENLYPHQ